ncbi:MAG: SAM-dependent methyltransferase [Thermoguttaceae bacterium]|nr:SAM-dependent methyltransferase [Thermoguttaceae bacterium]
MTARCRPILLLVALVLAAWSLGPGGHLAAAETKAASLYLVGVGPGDPDLITVRALEVLKRAQIVYCSPGIREKFATELQGKEVVEGFWRLFPYYGKDPSTLDGQERAEAEELAAKRKDFTARVRQAVAAGKTVAILDNGDPLIYGPWEWCLEEFEDLRPVVVPGLSAFNAANAAIGKGVTTSERTKAVILTSTDWPGKTDTIERLAAHRSTMVLFTMRAEFDDFIRKLSAAYPPETPVAVVQHAGYQGKQRVLRGTLGTIREQVGREPLPFEYLIYVGDFLSHRYKKP